MSTGSWFADEQELRRQQLVPHRRLIAAVVAQGLRDVLTPAATEAQREDAVRFLSDLERCGQWLEFVDMDPEAFCERFRKDGAAGARAYLISRTPSPGRRAALQG